MAGSVLSGIAMNLQTTAESLAFMSFKLYTGVTNDAAEVMTAIASDPVTTKLANDLGTVWNSSDPPGDPTVIGDLNTIQQDLAGGITGVAGVVTRQNSDLPSNQADGRIAQ